MHEYVRLEGVSKRFGDFVAVDHVSLSIDRGEIFCLLGGSGCGKTTLLRMLAGFETPSGGRILIDGQDMAGTPPYERPVNKGQIVQVGTPTDIYEFPNSRFVADFIGSVNMFEGKLIEDEPGHVRIRCPELEHVVYVSHGISAPPEATVSVAIRPEKIELTRTEPAVTENRTQGIVQDIAYMGDMSVYLLRLASGRVLRVTLPNIERHADERIARGESVHLVWQPSSPVVLTA